MEGGMGMKTLTLESALMVHRGLLRRETREEEVEGVALCVWVRWGRGGVSEGADIKRCNQWSTGGLRGKNREEGSRVLHSGVREGMLH
jgi:hypothetical protein